MIRPCCSPLVALPCMLSPTAVLTFGWEHQSATIQQNWSRVSCRLHCRTALALAHQAPSAPRADAQVVTDFCAQHLPRNTAAFADPRLQLINDDARTQLESWPDKFDVIIGDLADPLDGGPCYQLYTQVGRAVLKAEGLGLRVGGMRGHNGSYHQLCVQVGWAEGQQGWARERGGPWVVGGSGLALHCNSCLEDREIGAMG